MKAFITLLTASVAVISSDAVSATTQIRTGKPTQCKKGYELVDGECKQICGGKIPNAPTCPNGYYCYGTGVVYDAPGHCEKLECGGFAGKPCQGGYWCDIVQTDIADGMGVCTDRKCPTGCAVWNDGCNTCQCGADGEIGCTEIACKEYQTPYCEKETDPSGDCNEIEAKFDKVQDGLVSDLVSLYNKLDDSHKKKFLDSIKNN